MRSTVSKLKLLKDAVGDDQYFALRVSYLRFVSSIEKIIGSVVPKNREMEGKMTETSTPAMRKCRSQCADVPDYK